jgi:hypothetical protein
MSLLSGLDYDTLRRRLSSSWENQVRKDRLIVGLICIALAVWLFLSGTTSDTVAPAVVIAVLGIIMVAIARKR